MKRTKKTRCSLCKIGDPIYTHIVGYTIIHKYDRCDIKFGETFYFCGMCNFELPRHIPFGQILMYYKKYIFKNEGRDDRHRKIRLDSESHLYKSY